MFRSIGERNDLMVYSLDTCTFKGSSALRSEIKFKLLGQSIFYGTKFVNEPTWRCHQNPFIGALGIQQPVILGEPQIDQRKLKTG